MTAPADAPWLVVGGDGVLGAALARLGGAVATTRRPERAGPDRPLLDLTQDPGAWMPPFTGGLAFLCAAVPDLAACADDPAGTRLLNVDATLDLARRLSGDFGFRLVYLSSCAVFDGREPRCGASRPPAPAGEYGRQKLAAERALLEACPEALVVRLTKVVHPGWRLWAGWRQALALGAPVAAFTDLAFAPLGLDLAVRGLAGLGRSGATGVWHWGGGEDLTCFEAARGLATALGVPADLVRPASGAAAGLPEGALVAHASLDSGPAEALLGLRVPGARAVLDAEVGP